MFNLQYQSELNENYLASTSLWRALIKQHVFLSAQPIQAIVLEQRLMKNLEMVNVMKIH